MVEDDPRDVELTLTALEDYKLANEVVVCRDGQEALDYLYCRGKFSDRVNENPAVMLLDLKLPKVDGLEVLQQVKSDERLQMIPVVMLTSSHEENDMMLLRSGECLRVKPENSTDSSTPLRNRRALGGDQSTASS